LFLNVVKPPKLKKKTVAEEATPISVHLTHTAYT